MSTPLAAARAVAFHRAHSSRTASGGCGVCRHMSLALRGCILDWSNPLPLFDTGCGHWQMGLRAHRFSQHPLDTHRN